jgi:hypothetical protein
MRALSYDRETAASLMLDQLSSFTDAARSFSEYDLLGSALVHGWSRLDVVVHVRAGLEEMNAVCAGRGDGTPTHDAASYWADSDSDDDIDDPVPHILWMRRTASAYARPSSALRHLCDVAGMSRLALSTLGDETVLFQGKTMAPGDFVATWVTELAVHQLDLGPAAGHPTAGALGVVRRTAEALADVDLPAEWDDESAALIALGRRPLPADGADLAGVLPLSL